MKRTIVFTFVLMAAQAVAAETSVECASEPDDRLRLACYDKKSGRSTEPPKEPVATVDGVAAQSVTSIDTGRASSGMEKAWELGPNDKRGTFIVRTYMPNFILPAHFTSNINRSPSSPTHPDGGNNPNYKPAEVKLQLSLRAKVAEDLLLPGADLWVAYTQRSLWQVWDSEDSSPFRSTDYQPEAIYIVPVPEKFGTLPFGWNLRMLQLGAAHQSNGQSDPLSRSWNRVYLGAGFERGNFGLLFRANQRVRIQKIDDNPDIVDYVGRDEISMWWSPGVSTVNLTWRTKLSSLDKGSLQLDWTYPVFADQPLGLRWYAQFFSGYGASMLDYNHRQNTLSFGLTLFQF
ncbi:MAG TPA: phospholipase A [Azonexus sp.]|nr:phospholipase A [Azonexus sp.]